MNGFMIFANKIKQTSTNLNEILSFLFLNISSFFDN